MTTDHEHVIVWSCTSIPYLRISTYIQGELLVLWSDCGRACAFPSRTKCKVNSLRERRSTGRVSCVILAYGHRFAEDHAREFNEVTSKKQSVFIHLWEKCARARGIAMLKSAVSRLHTRGLLHACDDTDYEAFRWLVRISPTVIYCLCMRWRTNHRK